jgi:hypothetical protein
MENDLRALRQICGTILLWVILAGVLVVGVFSHLMFELTGNEDRWPHF